MEVEIPTAVMSVARTKGGILVSRLKDFEQMPKTMTGLKTRIVDKCGTKLKDWLIKSNPWELNPCDLNDWTACKSDRSADNQKC